MTEDSKQNMQTDKTHLIARVAFRWQIIIIKQSDFTIVSGQFFNKSFHKSHQFHDLLNF